MEKRHVFIVGAKSLGVYGGYETFVDRLTEYHQNKDTIQYHVAVKANGQGCMDETKVDAEILSGSRFIYHNAECFKIHVPEKLGPAQAVFYDVAALRYCCRYIKKNHIQNAAVYILACRIGPFARFFVHKIHALGGTVYLNPDGHEWMRAKWSGPIRTYWKISERMMVKHSDWIICDSKHIEAYIQKSYESFRPRTDFIAYGAETRKSTVSDEALAAWCAANELKAKEYYLIVGRFVPENNYETMIREFMKSKTEKNLVIITNVGDGFLAELERKLHFSSDARIRFVGTVYDRELLMKIRENAYGYIHGHEVGGTNPSLLEALGSTDLNLLLDVGFNREVAEEGALYWSKKSGDLMGRIDEAEAMSSESIEALGEKAHQRIKQAYSWDKICDQYERIWLGEGG